MDERIGPLAVPALLVLTPEEADALTRHARALVARAAACGQAHVAALAQQAELARILVGRDPAHLAAQFAEHYRALLGTAYDGVRREALLQLGARHQQLGIDDRWLVLTNTLFMRDLHEGIRDLGLAAADAIALRRALAKRCRLDLHWMLEGHAAAEASRLATRESFYRALAEANRLFASSAPQAPLPAVYAHLVELLVEALDLRLAWLGFVDPVSLGIEPLAMAGVATPYLQGIAISADGTRAQGRGPAGSCVRLGQPQVADAESDVDFAAWRSRARVHGIGGLVAAPLRLADGRRGVLALYRACGQRFPDDIAALAARLADDLAAFLDRRSENVALERLRRFQDALEHLQQALLARPQPRALFESLVSILQSHTDAYASWVHVPYNPSGLRAIAVGARDAAMDTMMRALLLPLDVGAGLLSSLPGVRAFLSGTPVVARMVDDASLQYVAAQHEVARSVAVVGAWPLFGADPARPVAVFSVAASESDYFNAPLRRLFDQLAAGVRVALLQHADDVELRRLSYSDALTDLPNRTAFETHVRAQLAQSLGQGDTLAVGILDLDGFKVWNDTYGHAAGDVLLTTVAGRLARSVRGGDLIARLGGDEFGLVVRTAGADDLAALSARLLAAVIEGDPELERVSGSLGWAVAPRGGRDFSELLMHADEAMYAAKSAGRATFRIYEGEVAAHAERRLAVRHAFPLALEGGAIRFWMQPVADLAAARLLGFEMLARWEDDSGVRPAAVFIAEVERDPALVRALGRHALATARRLRDVLADRGRALSMALNIGSGHLLHPGFTDDLQQLLGPSARGIVLEVTEAALIADLPRAQRVLQAAQAQGARIALDDFGSGHLSLQQAARLPVDELKLDRSLIAGLPTGSSEFAVASAAILLAHMLGKPLVAEGIETGEELELWLRMGGRYAQGYWLGRPMPESALADWIDALRLLPRPTAAPPLRDLILIGSALQRPEALLARLQQGADNALLAWFEERAGRYGRLSAWDAARAGVRELAGNAGIGAVHAAQAQLRTLLAQIEANFAQMQD